MTKKKFRKKMRLRKPTKLSSDKCIKKGSEYRRVVNAEADALVNQGWQFCPRSEWRATQ